MTKDLLGFQKFYGLVVVKPLVCPDNYGFYRGWQFGKRGNQKFDASCSSMSISRTKFSMPEIFGDTVET